jgi:di/tricarboxylate transporter
MQELFRRISQNKTAASGRLTQAMLVAIVLTLLAGLWPFSDFLLGIAVALTHAAFVTWNPPPSPPRELKVEERQL